MAVLAGHEPCGSSGHAPRAGGGGGGGGGRMQGGKERAAVASEGDPSQLLTLYFSAQASLLFTA